MLIMDPYTQAKVAAILDEQQAIISQMLADSKARTAELLERIENCQKLADKALELVEVAA